MFFLLIVFTNYANLIFCFGRISYFRPSGQFIEIIAPLTVFFEKYFQMIYGHINDRYSLRIIYIIIIKVVCSNVFRKLFGKYPSSKNTKHHNYNLTIATVEN